MSKPEDNNPVDNELKAYLAGADGVSAAYRQTGTEEPPAELDRLILAAAHSAVGSTVESAVGSGVVRAVESSAESSVKSSVKSPADNAVQKNPSRTTGNMRQRFSLAASFMIGVLVTSMYFNQGRNNVLSGNTSDVSSFNESDEQLISRSLEQPAPASVPAAPSITSQESTTETLARAAPPDQRQTQAAISEPKAQVDDSNVAEAAQKRAAETSVTREVQVTSAAGDLLADATQLPLERIPAAADAGQAAEVVLDQRVSNQPLMLEDATAAQPAPAELSATQLIANSTAALSASPPVPNREQPRAQADTAGQLEEIQVTGSRIRAVDREQSYRESQQQWLEQILALAEEIVVQTDALEENSARLEEEMELFTQTYPDVDIEAELQGLKVE